MIRPHFLALLLAVPSLATPAAPAAGAAAPTVNRKLETVNRGGSAAAFFPISQVRLLDGPFKLRYDTNTRYLLDTLDPDRLLAPYRAQAGLKPKAPFYGGWEARGAGASGHTLGHYLTALSYLQATTDAPATRAEALRRINYIVDELTACRRAKGDPAIMPLSKRVDYPLENLGIRVPFYNLHKLLAGLRDAYELAHDKNALALSRSIADWLDALLRPLTPKQIQRMLAPEYGGMNEPLADLAADTGDPRYLRMAATYFHRDALLLPLYRNEDRLGSQHANAQIPVLVGLAREYELTADPRYRAAATAFWREVVDDRTYAIGGHGESEHFFPPEKFPDKLTSRTCETCNVNNMLKLARHLFEWSPDAAQMDYVERALVNQLASAIGENPGEFTYFLPLGSVAVKSYSKPTGAFWCCVGTGMENPAKYAEQIYARTPDSTTLYINQYIAAALDWPEQKLRLAQETQFPDSDTIRIKLTTADANPRHFTLKLRHPAWCPALEIKINGQPLKDTSSPATYLTLTRDWHNGDTITLRLPMTLHAEPLPHSDNKIISLLYGPNVLAALIPGTPDTARYASQLDARGKTDAPPPLIVAQTPAAALARLTPVPNRFGEFLAPENLFRPDDPAATRPALALSSCNGGVPGHSPARGHDASIENPKSKIENPPTLTLRPLRQIYDEPYAVYFPILTPAEWPAREAKIAAARQARQKLAAATLATVSPGDANSESQHALRKENSQSGELFDRHYRVARDGGWFSYDMPVLPDAPVTLIATYWGGLWDERNFDISIDGRHLASQSLYNNSPGDFIDIPCAIPPEWTRDKTKVTVRFTARPKTAELYALRTVRTDALPPSQ